MIVRVVVKVSVQIRVLVLVAEIVLVSVTVRRPEPGLASARKMNKSHRILFIINRLGDGRPMEGRRSYDTCSVQSLTE